MTMNGSRGSNSYVVKQVAAAFGCLLLFVVVMIFPFLMVIGFYLLPVIIVLGLLVWLLRRQKRHR
jgi:4-amino-4-deoxy-L-arabinose transferase-like glycosyltransferase